MWDPTVASVPFGQNPAPATTTPPLVLSGPTDRSARTAVCVSRDITSPLWSEGGCSGSSWTEVVLPGRRPLLVHGWLPPLPCAPNIAGSSISPERQKPSGQERGSRHPDGGQVTFLLCTLGCISLNASLPVPDRPWAVEAASSRLQKSPEPDPAGFLPFCPPPAAAPTPASSPGGLRGNETQGCCRGEAGRRPPRVGRRLLGFRPLPVSRPQMLLLWRKS